MRLYLSLLISLCSLTFAAAQPKVVFPDTEAGHCPYPAAELDHFLNLSRYKAVLFGENHAVFFEPDFKYRLIRQLNDTYDNHDVFMEIGHSAAFLFNHYLETGDSSVFTHPVLPYTWPAGRYRFFWDSLRNYNRSLPEGQKIVIHGVDFERAEVFKTLLLLRPAHKPVPAALQEGFGLLTQYAATAPDNPFDKELLRELKEITHIFEGQEAALRDYYEGHYGLVSRILHNDAPHNTRVPQRNKYMMDAMQSAIAAGKIERFSGFFGGAHTNYQDRASLVNRLNKTEAFSGQILSLNAVYFNAYNVHARRYLNYLGLIKSENSQLLHDTYLPSGTRAVLLHNSDITNDKFLSHAADYVLLANDTASAR